jgi:chitinase
VNLDLICRALDLDDFKNVCGCEEYPLLRTINRVLRKYKGPHNDCILESRKKVRPTVGSTTAKPAERPSSRKPDPTTKKPVEPTTRKPQATTKKPELSTRKPTTSTRQRTTTTTTTEDPDYYPDEDPEEGPELSDPVEVCSQGRLFVADDSDCASYYQCDHGTAHKKT